MRPVLAVVALAAIAGCGYGLAGRGPAVPVAARTVEIGAFANQTREYGLEIPLRGAIEEEFRRRGTLSVVPEGEGDLRLSGRIRRFQASPVAFRATSEAVQYQGVIQVAFKLVERASGRVIAENPLLQESLDFGAVSTVVIGRSPRFQRGTINVQDLSTMTSVQFGETRRRETLAELVDIVAHDIYLQSIEGF